jgi:hypothetical protein
MTRPTETSMPEYRIILTLATPASQREVEELAAELVADARAHLTDGERLALASVEPALPERHPEPA